MFSPTNFLEFLDNACIFTPPFGGNWWTPVARVNLSHMNFFTGIPVHQSQSQSIKSQSKKVARSIGGLKFESEYDWKSPSKRKGCFSPELNKTQILFQGNGRKENQMLMRRNQVLTAAFPVHVKENKSLLWRSSGFLKRIGQQFSIWSISFNHSAEKQNSRAPSSLYRISCVNMKKVGNKHLVNDVYRHEDMI